MSKSGVWVIIVAMGLGVVLVGKAAYARAAGIAGDTGVAPAGIAVIVNDRGPGEWAVDLRGHALLRVSTAVVAPSPDATMIAYETTRGNRSRVNIRLHRLSGGPDATVASFERPRAANWGGPYERLAWAPNGRAIAISELAVSGPCPPPSSTPFSVAFLDGRPRLVVHAVPFARRIPGSGIIVQPLAWSHNSRYLLYAQREMSWLSDPEECFAVVDSRVLMLDTATGRVRLLASAIGAASQVSEALFSPDDRSVLFIRGDDFTGVPWIVRVDGSHRRRLATSRTALAAFSPDGRAVALLEIYKNAGHLIVEQVDGTHRRQIARRARYDAPTIIWRSSWEIVTSLSGHLIVSGLRLNSPERVGLRPLVNRGCNLSREAGWAIVIDDSPCRDVLHRDPLGASLLLIEPRSGRTWRLWIAFPEAHSSLGDFVLAHSKSP